MRSSIGSLIIKCFAWPILSQSFLRQIGHSATQYNFTLEFDLHDDLHEIVSAWGSQG